MVLSTGRWIYGMRMTSRVILKLNVALPLDEMSLNCTEVCHGIGITAKCLGFNMYSASHRCDLHQG